MKLMAWDDGRVVETKDFRLPYPYVLQRVHTLDYQPYNVSRHLMLLRDASIALFGFATLCSVADAERIITRLLNLSRVSRKLSTPVAMRLDALGHLSFEVEQTILYEGYSLRAKRISLATLTMPLPEYMSQTSVSVAVDAMADSRVAGSADAALWVDDKGAVISRPWMPLFAVYGGRVYTPAEYDTVEYIVTRDAIRRVGAELIVHPMTVASLKRMDEVFIVDAMGVTSVATIEEHRLLSMITARIADNM
ncbi:MAG: hypothetical protein IJX40_05575 [Alistipes sp.]|nr:hypothetical protein [Alistipes sp.]